MAYWLIKSEPDVWSWDQQTKAKKTEWSRRAQPPGGEQSEGDEARRPGVLLSFECRQGDRRHRRIVAEAYPDPGDPAGRFVMVDVKAIAPLPRPVTLDEIKRDPALESMALLKQSRLSVQPVTAAEWKHINALAKK